MGDNVQFVEKFSVEGNNPSTLGLQNENFKHLDLRGNHEELNYIPYNLLVEVRDTLEVLILSNNHFAKIGNKSEDIQPNQNIFPTMENLLFLELDYCNIKWIRDGAFDNLPLLKNLSLKHNFLDSIPPAIYLHSLEHLQISGTIQSGQSSKQDFKLPSNFSQGKLSQLKSLSFGHFLFPFPIEPKAFVGLPNLTKIVYDRQLKL